MTSFILAGGLGALLNCALFSHFSSMSVEHLLQEMFIQPLSALRTLLPVVFGFFGGTLLLLIWNFLKARVVRFLLDYNGWFLHPKRPINKLWYLLMIAFLGRKPRMAGKYTEFLPSYPVPPLKSTCKKYLDSVRPLLTPEEYQETESVVKEFMKKDGPKLQWMLTFRSWQKRNWLADWWRDFIYLKQRRPIPFNSNYFAIGVAKPLTNHQLDRAAMHIHTSAKFCKQYWQYKVENAIANGIAPFCMDGHRYLHMTARIPGDDIDKLVSYRNEKPRHIVVCWQGKFYHVEVVSGDGKVLPPKEIKQQLEKVVEMAGDEQDKTGVATFTALPRAKWAQIRQRMEKSAVNCESLRSIDSCYNVICLDSESVEFSDMTGRARLLFHGNGYNRWFDKGVQLIISSNGVSGANVEHSSIDATVASQLWEYMLSEEKYDECGHVLDQYPGEEAFDVPPPTELKWELEDFQTDLQEAKRNLTEMIYDSDLLVIDPGYGKAVPKKCHLSPDGWFQMALQLAFYRIYKKIVLTYESATTRLYYQGRTETIRPVSDMSVKFVKTMDDPDVPRDQVKSHLKKAVEYQCKYKFEAMRGLGVDRHLFGLYCVAKGMNLDPLPRIFQDKAFNLSFQLSTSQTPVKNTNRWSMECSAQGGGFGTVMDDGYGVSYVVVGEDNVNFSVHSKRSCPTTNSQKFAEELRRAMTDMRDLYGV